MNKEKEIDLKLIFYYSIKKWRTILLIGIIVSIVIGVIQTIGYIRFYSNDDNMKQAKTEYDITVQEHEAKGRALENDLNNLKKVQSQQQIYNKNSILMAINPYDEYVGQFSFYIDTDYQIMPDKSYQDVDKTEYILDIYESFLRNGALYSQLTKYYNHKTEERYLEEIVEIDRNTNLITVFVKNYDEESCKTLVGTLKQILDEKTTEIKSIFDDFDYSITNESYYSCVDAELNTYQQEKTRNVTDLASQIAETSNKYNEWKAAKKPIFEYEPNQMIRTVVKNMTLSGSISLFVVFLSYVFFAIFTDKILSPGELNLRLGLNILGELPNQYNRYIDKMIIKSFNYESKINSTLDAYSFICSNMEANKSFDVNKTFALVGAIDQEKLNELMINLKKIQPDFHIIVAGDITIQANAIDIVRDSDGVILVEMLYKSTNTLIQDEIRKVCLWNKEIIGVIAM